MTKGAGRPVALEMARVAKAFRAPRYVEVLRDISFSVAEGEFVCLLGPSGCGKSTLLNMFAGFEEPDEGMVLFRGEPVKGPGPKRGVVFQEPALFPWLTVLKNLTFGPKMSRMNPKTSAARAQKFLELVGLEGFENHYPAELSGGMRQRVAIARVLMMNPDILLMDEPFGALDAQTRSVMQKLLLDIWGRYAKPVLFITHDVEEAIYLADTVYVMTARPGQIKAKLRVDLPRPRESDIVTTGHFNRLKSKVLELIREEAMKSAVSIKAEA